jgi:REP element-mobilizing transposase RayT
MLAKSPVPSGRLKFAQGDQPMANTYTSLHYHLIFGTKNRAAFIKPEIEQRLWADLGGVARKHKLTTLQIGGCDDHIHALLMAPPVIAPSQIAQFLNRHSS